MFNPKASDAEDASLFAGLQAEPLTAGSPSPGAPDQWETLDLTPFLGVSAGGGLATDGAYLYAADFSGDGDYDYVDLNLDLSRDAGESLQELGYPNGSVRMARYDPASATWAMLPTLNGAGVGRDAFSAGDFVNPLFVATGKLYYYQFRAGPNTRALYAYDLAAGLTGTWQTIWEKTDADDTQITGNAGIRGIDVDGQPVIFHHWVAGRTTSRAPTTSRRAARTTN